MTTTPQFGEITKKRTYWNSAERQDDQERYHEGARWYRWRIECISSLIGAAFYDSDKACSTFKTERLTGT